MTRTYFKFAFILCIFCLASCSEEEDKIVPLLELEPLPEGSVAFLNIRSDGQEYNLINGVDNSIFSSSLVTPADENALFTNQYGSSVTSDTSTLIFRVAYSRSSDNRRELLHEITQTEGKIGFGEFTNFTLIERRTGFNIEVSELESPNGPGQGYSSWRTPQPDASFFTINEYYAGETVNTIWLKGEFRLTIEKEFGRLDQVRGDFLMEFPVCCFN